MNFIEQLNALYLTISLPSMVLPPYVFLHYTIVMVFLFSVISGAHASAKVDAAARRADEPVDVTCENENGDDGDDETGSCSDRSATVPPITITSSTTTIVSNSMAEVADLVASSVDQAADDNNADGKTIVQTFVIHFPAKKDAKKTITEIPAIEKLPVIVATANEKAPRKYFEVLTTVKEHNASARKYFEVLVPAKEECTPSSVRKYFEVISASPKVNEPVTEERKYYEVLPTMHSDKDSVDTHYELLPAAYDEKLAPSEYFEIVPPMYSAKEEPSVNATEYFEELPTAYQKNTPIEDAEHYEILPAAYQKNATVEDAQHYEMLPAAYQKGMPAEETRCCDEILPAVYGEKTIPMHFELVKAGDYSSPIEQETEMMWSGKPMNDYESFAQEAAFEEIQYAVKAHKVDPSAHIPILTGLANQYFKNRDSGNLATPSTAATIVVDPYEHMWANEPVHIIDCVEEDEYEEHCEEEQEEEDENRSVSNDSTATPSCSASVTSSSSDDSDDDDDKNTETVDWRRLYPQSSIIPLLSKKPFSSDRTGLSSLFSSQSSTRSQTSQNADPSSDSNTSRPSRS